MRTVTTVVIEDNPHFVWRAARRGDCSHCGRSIRTYKRANETHLRFYWHNASQGAGTFADPIQWRKCAGSGQAVES